MNNIDNKLGVLLAIAVRREARAQLIFAILGIVFLGIPLLLLSLFFAFMAYSFLTMK